MFDSVEKTSVDFDGGEDFRFEEYFFVVFIGHDDDDDDGNGRLLMCKCVRRCEDDTLRAKMIIHSFLFYKHSFSKLYTLYYS